MAELLSQTEIDQLLNNVKSGTESSQNYTSNKEVIPFDFRLPNRISKNQLRTMRNIHENFAEGFSSFLVSKLQSIVNIHVTSVDQIYYSEYVLSVPNPACLFTFDIVDTDIKGILELSPELAITLVERLLGGNGYGSKSTNLITPIEQKILGVVVERIMGDLQKSWQMIDNYEFAVDRFEPDVDFAQITSPSESVLLVSFEISFGEKAYLMNICFATYAFDTVLAKLSSQKLSSIRPAKYKGTTSEEIVSSKILQADIPLKIEFGHATVTMNELMNLKKGDVVKLKTRISEELKVKVEDKVLFFGKVGVINNKKAVKITHKVF
ncbi:MAG: flagellar motor switch protein FliM [Melioribacteraceae bacterium]|nr:flagellar motor switch protein FliM [Melioribacteraceae bacterium]